MVKAEFNGARRIEWCVVHEEVSCVVDAIQLWTRPRGLSDYTRLAFWGSGLTKPWIALWYAGKRWVIEGVTDKVIGKHWRVTGDGLPMPLRGTDLYDLLAPLVRKEDTDLYDLEATIVIKADNEHSE